MEVIFIEAFMIRYGAAVAQEVVFTWEGDAKEVLVSADYLKWEAKLPLQRSANGSFSIKQVSTSPNHARI